MVLRLVLNFRRILSTHHLPIRITSTYSLLLPKTRREKYVVNRKMKIQAAKSNTLCRCPVYYGRSSSLVIVALFRGKITLARDTFPVGTCTGVHVSLWQKKKGRTQLDEIDHQGDDADEKNNSRTLRYMKRSADAERRARSFQNTLTHFISPAS